MTILYRPNGQRFWVRDTRLLHPDPMVREFVSEELDRRQHEQAQNSLKPELRRPYVSRSERMFPRRS